MDLSVVVSTLNARERLAGCLDALAERVPGAEVVVVNGPSTDGTTGMVRERAGVDVLVEIADRNVNVARNAGIERARGDVVAFLGDDLSIEEGWFGALDEHYPEAPVVTGPTHQQLRAGMETESVETRTIAGRAVTYFNGANVAFCREVLDELDGFDESLSTGGARDAAHRLAALGHQVVWESAMCVSRELGTDGGRTDTDWRRRYRSLSYRLVKNYGFRPTVANRIARHAGQDALDAFRDVLRGEGRPSSWLGNGRDVLFGIGGGSVDGALARLGDRSPRRNPSGRSTRTDRAVAVYDAR
jgi:glycosyltransferase involved in cell wall biosynthesis